MIVATPERLEAILRNPGHQGWLETVGAVCVDEAHLIGNPKRGPVLEYLLTSLLGLEQPPRLVLLSATLGDVTQAENWLSPCAVVKVSERYPPLYKDVLEVGPEQEANAVLADWLRAALQKADTQALVFVYQTRSTASLARELTETLGDLAGEQGALAYHSQLSSTRREQVRKAFLAGHSRVVVTTSALALGVNLPATHVAVRDLTYPGAESPQVADLLQMLGRAGRGNQSGHAVVLKRPNDAWGTDELRQALDKAHLPELRSAFADNAESATNLVASLLARAGDNGRTSQELERFFKNSLGGHHLASQTAPALRWFEQHTLAWQEEGRYRLTGKHATLSALPLPLTAGYAQLIRDLLSLDDKLLAQWQPLDHLLLLHLLHDNSPKLRRFSAKLAEQVSAWCESRPEQAPLLFNHWLDGENLC